MASLDLNNPLTQNKSSKLYSPRLQELRDSIINKKQKTKTEVRSELPYININGSQFYHKKETKLLSSSNRHLRYLFHQFCKQSYVGGAHATFDQIAQSSDFMTLNKWMVFCKQFQLTQKLSNRQAMQIFKTVTNQRPEMDVTQFCRALQVVQQKSKANPEEFATEVLHVDSHASARKRMCVMKINFSGPKTNFFMQSQLTQKQRAQQKNQFKQYKQKQRQYVLHQGMFKQQIEHLISERKSQRNQKWLALRNRSAIQPKQRQQRSKQLQKQQLKKQPLVKVTPAHKQKLKSRSVFGNYSKIFQNKKISNTNSTSNSNMNSSVVQEKKIKDDILDESQSKSRLKFQQKKHNNNSDLFVREMNQRQQNESMIQDDQNYFQINSDTQSDIILKNHYQNEKKLKQNRFKDSKVEQKTIQDNNQFDTDLMITRYN